MSRSCWKTLAPPRSLQSSRGAELPPSSSSSLSVVRAHPLSISQFSRQGSPEQPNITFGKGLRLQGYSAHERSTVHSAFGAGCGARPLQATLAQASFETYELSCLIPDGLCRGASEQGSICALLGFRLPGNKGTVWPHRSAHLFCLHTRLHWMAGLLLTPFSAGATHSRLNTAKHAHDKATITSYLRPR